MERLAHGGLQIELKQGPLITTSCSGYPGWVTFLSSDLQKVFPRCLVLAVENQQTEGYQAAITSTVAWWQMFINKRHRGQSLVWMRGGPSLSFFVWTCGFSWNVAFYICLTSSIWCSDVAGKFYRKSDFFNGKIGRTKVLTADCPPNPLLEGWMVKSFMNQGTSHHLS